MVENVAQGEDRVPALSLALQFGELSLLVAGYTTRGAPDLERTTVLRLAPELSLDRSRAQQLADGSGRLAVVGGRRAALGSDSPGQFLLSGSEVVELLSDGIRTQLLRTPCPSGSDRCAWPSDTLAREPA